jgi:hypothetical protein
MSACAKEPNRQTGVFPSKATETAACAKEPSRQTGVFHIQTLLKNHSHSMVLGGLEEMS